MLRKFCFRNTFNEGFNIRIKNDNFFSKYANFFSTRWKNVIHNLKKV